MAARLAEVETKLGKATDRIGRIDSQLLEKEFIDVSGKQMGIGTRVGNLGSTTSVTGRKAEIYEKIQLCKLFRDIPNGETRRFGVAPLHVGKQEWRNRTAERQVSKMEGARGTQIGGDSLSHICF